MFSVVVFLLLLVAVIAVGRPSRAASARPHTASSGACSLANVRQQMARYGLLSDPQLSRPVGRLICGAFAGPGSIGMAASSVHGVCLPYAGWGAFRYVNGGWQLIPGGRHDTILTLGISKAGNDIVEKMPVRHPGETICTASGVRSRTWHWNGKRLVAAAWRTTLPGRGLDSFRSQNGKVWCRIIKDVTENDAWCGTRSPERLATVKRNGQVTICTATGPGDCLQNWDDHAPILRSGKTNLLNGFSCQALGSRITCTVIAGAGKGQGFMIDANAASKLG